MRRPSDKPTAWLVWAEGGHREGHGPQGSLPVCRGQLPWQARPGRGWGGRIGLLLSGAREGHPPRRAALGQRGSPAEADARMLVAARCQVSMGAPVGPGSGEEASPGKEGVCFRGASRVAAGSGWELHHQPYAISRA